MENGKAPMVSRRGDPFSHTGLRQNYLRKILRGFSKNYVKLVLVVSGI